jgi:hypothetical protein
MNIESIRIGGYQVFWDFSETLLANLTNRLVDVDLGAYAPTARTKLVCLRAALSDVFHPEEKYVFRPLKNGITGYAVVCERPGEDKGAGDAWASVVATAGFNVDGLLVLDPCEPDKRCALTVAIDEESRWITASEVGSTMKEYLKKLDCVTMPVKGGSYWINASRFGELQKMSGAIEGATVRDGQENNAIDPLSVVANESMVRACGRALTHEIERDLKNIEDEISEAGLSEDSCLTRLKRVGELSEKVKRYEESFQKPLTSLTDAVQRSAVAVAQATIQASAAAQRSHMAAASV